MRWSETYIPTLREVPAEAELASHQYLIRAGYMRRLAPGIYSYLPLMKRVIDKISTIIREEMTAAGAIELTMPILQSGELWRESGREEKIGKKLMRLKDRYPHDQVLGPSHEETIIHLMMGELKSYRQMPKNLFQINTKFRDDIQPRHGLLWSHEFLTMDAYSFDLDEEAYQKSRCKMESAFSRIFDRCRLPVVSVESNSGSYGTEAVNQFTVVLDSAGSEHAILCCNRCDYAADLDTAVSREPNPPFKATDQKPLQEIATPNATTVEEVTSFLKIDSHHMAKTLVYMADGNPIAVMIRGDRQINETKLSNYLGCGKLEMAGPEIVEGLTNAPVGFAGPVKLDIPIIADTEVSLMTNFVTGANKTDFHLINVNFNRDFKPIATIDIRNVSDGDGCPWCEGKLAQSQGIGIGCTRTLGTAYSEALGGKYLDSEGRGRYYFIGSYDIAITRMVQTAIEKFHDEKGIIWPRPIAPYQIALLPLNIAAEKVGPAAGRIYKRLIEAGFDVLFDDRNERAGVKFYDSDLIGIPLRVAIGERSLAEGAAELKLRREKRFELSKINDVVDKAGEMLKRAN